jgi:hypothetical protein
MRNDGYEEHSATCDNVQFFLNSHSRKIQPRAGNAVLWCLVIRRVKFQRRNAMKKLLLAGAVLAIGATPVLADFYIVREGSGPCRIVETRPTDTKIVVMGNKVFKTRADADKELAVVCKN